MEVVTERNPDNHSPFEWVWSVIDETGIIAEGLEVTEQQAIEAAEKFTKDSN